MGCWNKFGAELIIQGIRRFKCRDIFCHMMQEFEIKTEGGVRG